MDLATFRGKKGRIVGTVLGLFALLVGVYITLGGNLLGPLFVVGGGYELGKVLVQSNYSITITSGRGGR